MVVNTVVVTKYDEYDNITLSVDVADSVAAIFKSFGIGHNPSTDRVMGRIKKTKLEAATRSWRHSEAGSVVYWLGHGRGPDPSRLLDSKSVSNRPNDGIGADDLIDDICRIGQESEFIIIILEACRIREFVQDLKKGLEERPNFNCATLILYSSERVTIPHDVLTELRQILDDVFGAEPEFYLARLWAEFVIKSKEMSVAAESLNISNEVLRRTAPVPAGQTLDVHRRLRKVLGLLNVDEREHFVSKAQSAGSGELTWNFEGRDHERQTVLTWLEDDSSPICIVRGEAGQGKSAFLGDIITRCRPDLADALIHAGLMTRVDSWNEIGHQVLPISINASGLTTEQLVERAIRDLSESSDAGAGNKELVEGIDELLVLIEKVVESLDRRVVFIIDGVDEMQDPIEGARIIGALSSRRGLKVLVACRDTPNEGQQFFAFAHADIVQSILETAIVGQSLEIVLGPDHEAIERYIRRRLQSHLVNRELPERLGLPVKDFLHASVLVREIACDPEWLDDWKMLVQLVTGGLVELYDLMLRRLSAQNPAFFPLFHACALSQGRGLPIAGDVWLTIARAVGGNHGEIDQKSLADFLNATEQYLRVDVEHDQTVYRPGHALLRSFLLGTLTDVSSYHCLLAEVCASQVGDDSSNVYYRHAATMHARRSNREGWWAIDRITPPVWNLLDRHRVVEDAMRDLFGRAGMPSGVEDLVLGHHFTAHLGQAKPVEGWSQAVRRGTYSAPATEAQGKAAWLRWARNVIRQPVFLTLPGHRGRVTAIREALLGPGESGLLVGMARGEVWLWNLASGGVVTTFNGLTGGIFAVASVLDTEQGLVVIAGDITGQLAAWSAKSRRQLWTSPVSVHSVEDGQQADRSGPVLGIAPVELEGVAGAIVVTSDQLCLVGLLEGSLVATAPAEGLTFGSSVVSFVSEDGIPMILVSTSDKQRIATYAVRPVASGWTFRQRDFIMLPTQLISLRHIHETPDTFRLLLSDGKVMQWAPGTGLRRSVAPAAVSITLGDVSGSTTGLIDVRLDKASNYLQIRSIDADGLQNQVIASHGGEPTAVQVIDRPGGRALAATGGSDRTVRVWDPYSSGSQGTSNTSLVRRVVALPAGGGKTLGVVATQDGNVQFLDGANARVIKSWRLPSGTTSLASSTGNPGRALIAAGTLAGDVHLWKQSGVDRPQKLMLPGNFGGRVVVDIDPSGELVATATSDGSVTVWVQTHQLDQKFEAHLELSHVMEVKVLKPFEDLVLVIVLTQDGVHSLEFSLERSRWVETQRRVPHGLPRSLSFSMYAAGTRIGLLSGAVDGQVHSIPRLWTPKARLSTEDCAAPGSLRLRQPVTAIHAHLSVDGTVVVAAGAYGRIVSSRLHEHVSRQELDLGQHIASVSAWDEDNLLAAVQGGIAFLAFGEAS